MCLAYIMFNIPIFPEYLKKITFECGERRHLKGHTSSFKIRSFSCEFYKGRKNVGSLKRKKYIL